MKGVRWLQKKKSKGSRSGESGGQVTGLQRPINTPEYETWKWLNHAIEKCAGAPSCINHTSWCVVASNSLQQLREK
ncbi:hypothetical protein TNCV_815431 [Trichonephila clavipes]|nr:hypothetical protein TNCV_815431 [Trichonephila clavipes]